MPDEGDWECRFQVASRPGRLPRKRSWRACGACSSMRVSVGTRAGVGELQFQIRLQHRYPTETEGGSNLCGGRMRPTSGRAWLWLLLTEWRMAADCQSAEVGRTSALTGPGREFQACATASDQTGSSLVETALSQTTHQHWHWQ
jgi:hypothetical protein